MSANDLESRVQSRKRELIEELVEHKKSVRPGAAEASGRIKERLDDLSYILKECAVLDWTSVDKSARDQLELWIAR